MSTRLRVSTSGGSAEGQQGSPVAANDSANTRTGTPLATEPPAPAEHHDRPPCLAFEYADEDAFEAEISEFFSYSENASLFTKSKAWHTWAAEHGVGGVLWSQLSAADREESVLLLTDELERAGPVRVRALRCLVHLALGAPTPDMTKLEQLTEMRATQRLFCEMGLLPLWIEGMFSTRTLNPLVLFTLYTNLVFLYIMCNRKVDEHLAEQLVSPLPEHPLFVAALFSLLNEIDKRPYPIKKLIVLLWKSILVTMGSMAELREWKTARRAEVGLPPAADTGDAAALKTRPEDYDKYAEYMDAVRKRLQRSRADMDARVPTCLSEAEDVMGRSLYVSVGELVHNIEQREGDDVRPRALMRAPTLVEQLYRALLPSLPRYLVNLLKVLLAASPTVKKYTGTINLNLELDICESNGIDLQSFRARDIVRQKEILTKAVSAVLLLLLKHFRFNHVMQFHYVAQLLVDSNCILLILKYFNQDMTLYTKKETDVRELDLFARGWLSATPSIGSVVTARTAVQPSSPVPSPTPTQRLLVGTPSPGTPASGPKIVWCNWRNVFASVNLLRVVLRLSHDMPVRLRNLVHYKAPIILKRTLKVNDATVQYFVLKLIKDQVRLLGKKWKSAHANMKVITMIYLRVKTGINDRWMCNDLPRAYTPEGMKREDQRLRRAIDVFNARHYTAVAAVSAPAATVEASGPVLVDEADMQWVAALDVEPSEVWKVGYARWLDGHVFHPAAMEGLPNPTQSWRAEQALAACEARERELAAVEGKVSYVADRDAENWVRGLVGLVDEVPTV